MAEREVYKVDLPNFTQEFVSQINNDLILLQNPNKDNICSIYKYRPLICRTYHVRGNPKECECDYNNAVSKRLEQYGTKIGGYGNKIYSEFAGFIDYVNISIFKGELKDIRNYF